LHPRWRRKAITRAPLRTGAAESAGPGLKAQARLDEGRALELAGKKAEAAAVYRKIGEETPDTLQKDLIDIKTAHME
jgi:predicted component of type VI protein secretion system